MLAAKLTAEVLRASETKIWEFSKRNDEVSGSSFCDRFGCLRVNDDRELDFS